MLTGPFRFDTAAHTYSVGGVPVPGIHAVLRAGGLEHGGKHFTQEHRDRGKAVHLATLRHDLGETRLVLPAEWQPFFDAYLLFRAEVECRWRKLEHPKVHRLLRYATIIDREGLVSGLPSVVELKTSNGLTRVGWHGVQLAGADMLLGGGSHRRRLVVYLSGSGYYRLSEFTDPADYFRFRGALESYYAEGSTDARGVATAAARSGSGHARGEQSELEGWQTDTG
jgi:hypothetical protein